MNLLDRIDVIEDALKSILELLEANKEKLDRLLVMRPPLTVMDALKKEPTVIKHSPGFEDYKPEIKEEVDMDFSKVLVMNQTEKALLVVKKGYQQWLAKSLIAGGGDGYDNGTTFDIPILEISSKSKKPTKWVFKKWEKFKVVKN